MISRNWIQITVGIAAGIYLIGFFVFDAPGETIVVRSYGLVVSLVSLLFVAFDKFIWKLPPVRSVFGWPVLHGTWKGTFSSSYPNPETGKREGPTKAYLTVRQSYSSMHVRFITQRSTSESLVCELKKKGDRLYEMYAIYENKPPILDQGTSRIHHGGVMLRIVGDPASALEGWYWTDRQTQGNLEFDKHSKHVYDNFSKASNGTYT